ncbi:MAG: response regulator [Bacteroidales bacterium]|nr:response regulator [Bacteroidales bacterium]
MVHRILIVDDNETNLLGLKMILRSIPVEIDLASSGFDAVQLAKNNRYSLVLLDIQMPEMDGFETLKNLRQLSLHEATPVILISAVYTEDQYKIKGMQTGAVDFIPKPVNPDIVRAKVQVFIDLEENRTKLRSLIDELNLKNRLLTEEIQKSAQITKELEIARANAEKASDYKSQLLVNMSHEIRTPVNSILGFADLIVNPLVPKKDKEKYLRYVSNSSKNLLFLIDEILDHSKLETGELKISVSPLDICGLCAELFDYFEKIKRQERKENITLHLSVDPTAGNFILNTDSQRLRQILNNLLNNAFKYTESGQIFFGFQKKDTWIEFFVKDTGVGVAPENTTEIFSRFKRAENPNVLIPGTGLGLSISKNLVELLGGKIWVESELGHGSEFRFTVPMIPPEAAISENPQTTVKLPDDHNWYSRTILIAEDEDLNFLFLQESLRITGLNILRASTGRESVDLAKNHPEIELVLMDIRLPDFDGYEATAQIKSMRPELPVIVQTAYALQNKKNNGIHVFVDELVTKPINRMILLQKMAKYLNR